MSNADIYHEMIIDYSRNPINYGKIEDHDITFHDSNPLCGDSIDIDMKIDDNKVSDIKFHGKGCAICMACSSVLTEIAKGKNIDELCREYNVARSTIYMWRKKYGGIDKPMLKKLKELQKENDRLKKIVVQQALDIDNLKDLLGKDW